MGTMNTKEFPDLETPPRTSVQSRILSFDPRSPSCSITRTPIIVEETPDGINDPRSPTPGILRTPIAQALIKGRELDNKHLISDMEGSFTEHDTECEKIVSDSLPELQNLQLTDKIDTESSRLLPYDIELFKGLSDSERKRKIKAKVAKMTQPKQLFPSSKKPGLFCKDNTRSPLATRKVDTNTPLTIVQQKQSKKVEIARSCTMEHVNAAYHLDKENIDL